MPPSNAPQRTYRKLPGDFRGFLRRNTLWIGDDHLLLVDSTRFSETYKRFYLRDIQTITIRKAPRFVLPYYWILLALAATIFLIVGLKPLREAIAVPAFVVLFGVLGYLYVASMFQSCVCHLITRVNKVELGSLFRLRSAREFVDMMTPLLVAAQGDMPADWIVRSTNLEEVATAADRNPDAPVDLLPKGEFNWMTVLVFLLVLVDAGLTWAQMRAGESSTLSAPNMMNMVVLAVCATYCIVRLTRQKGSRVLRALVLAGLFVVAAVTYGSILVQSFDQQFFHQTFRNVMQYPGMRALGIGEIVADCAVAVPGLILAFRQRQAPVDAPSSFLNTGAPQA